MIIKYKVFFTSQEFEDFQKNNKIVIYNIYPVIESTSGDTKKEHNTETVNLFHEVIILVTYTEEEKEM